METEVVLAVNQIEYHSGWMQQETVSFCKENGVLPLPKSVTPSRIAANLDVFDF